MQLRNNNTEKKLRILLVEDEVQIRKMMKLNLDLEGYEVVETDDGLEALHLIEDQNFDLIILDIMLPNVNGFQICERIRLVNKEVGIILFLQKTQQKIGSKD